jgi:hypothetical protein
MVVCQGGKEYLDTPPSTAQQAKDREEQEELAKSLREGPRRELRQGRRPVAGVNAARLGSGPLAGWLGRAGPPALGCGGLPAGLGWAVLDNGG